MCVLSPRESSGYLQFPKVSQALKVIFINAKYVFNLAGFQFLKFSRKTALGNASFRCIDPEERRSPASSCMKVNFLGTEAKLRRYPKRRIIDRQLANIF